MVTCTRSLCRSARWRSQLHGLQFAEGLKVHLSPATRNVLMRGAPRCSYASVSTSESDGLSKGSSTPVIQKIKGKRSQEHIRVIRRTTAESYSLLRKHNVRDTPGKEQPVIRQPVNTNPVNGNEALYQIKSARSLWNSDGEPLLPPITLRDRCRCDQCIDPSTKQRSFSLHDIPTDVKACDGGKTDDGSFIVRWENDIRGFSSHTSTFRFDELKEIAWGNTLSPAPKREPANPWDATSIAERLMTVSYEDYMTSDKHFLGMTKALQRDGLVFVKGVPPSIDSVSQIVERIGPIRNTFYGSTWDVKSKPNAENVAYTDKELGFHMDLLYMDLPPKYQFLHCIQNTCTGGESRFIDIIYARQIMAADFELQANVLGKVSFGYHYQNQGHFYRSCRRVFDPSAEQTWWSPPFVEFFTPSAGTDVGTSLAAVKQFASILDRKDLAYETKMEEGTCAIFDNIRVLHARNAFDVNSGQRWLRGAYLDEQPLRSTQVRLMREEAAGVESDL